MSESARPTLTVAIMTRNDADRLDRALNSVEGLHAELLVLDTGSEDHTQEAAKKHGARIIEYPWPGRFDEPLNFMLDHVETDWVLRIDSDEWLDRQFHDAIRAVTADPNVFFVSMMRRDYGPNGQFADILQNRLWRSHPAMRYRGIVHEQIPNEATEVASQGRQHVFLDIRLDHDGYIDGINGPRLQRNLELIERELEERPGNIFYEICRADTLFMMQDERALDALDSIIQRLMKKEAPCDAIASAAVAQYMRAVLETRPRHPRTSKVIAFARNSFAEFPDVLWQAARLEHARGNLREAWDIMTALDRLGQSGRYNRQIGVNPAILTTMLWRAMGEIAPLVGRADLQPTLRQRIMAHERRFG